MQINLDFHFGSSAGRAGASDTTPTNCYNPLVQLTDGGYGYDESQVITGSITPTSASDGTHIYKSSFYTADGSFIFAYGVAGNEQLTNNTLIIYSYDDVDHVELTWDSTELYYIGYNTELANLMALEVGNNVCFSGIPIYASK